MTSMTTHRRRAAAVLLAVGMTLSAVAAQADEPLRVTGDLTDLRTGTADPTDGASARVQEVQHADGSTVTLHVWGLDPVHAGHTLGVHVHVGPCVEGSGATAGPHFNIDVYNGVSPAEVSPETEVWLDISIRGDGVGHAVAQVPFHIPDGAAQSIVIHEQHTDHTGAAGARLACLGVPF